jgi:hypothetical protein
LLAARLGALETPVKGRARQGQHLSDGQNVIFCKILERCVVEGIQEGIVAMRQLASAEDPILIHKYVIF